jgi:Rrf2 family protein
MLQLTKRTEYGLIALVHIAERGAVDVGAFVSAREICDRYPIPRRLVAEVLKSLQRHAIVESQRGAAGGYALTRRPENITLGQIVAALEGAPPLTSCESPIVLKTGGCEVQSMCPIRSPVHRVREQLWGLLEHTTLRSLLPLRAGEHVAQMHAVAAHAPERRPRLSNGASRSNVAAPRPD